MAYEHLVITREGPVEYLTLNRPDVRNAFNEHVIAELTEWAAQAASVLTTVKRDQLTREGKPFSSAEDAAIRQPILDKYEHEGSPYYSTARLWDDGILEPGQTRQALALGLSAAFNAPIPPPKFGVFRM